MAKKEATPNILNLKNNQEINKTFKELTNDEIEFILKNNGGLLSDNYEVSANAPIRDTVLTRPDAWALEVHYNAFTTKNEVWIRGTDKLTTNIESTCLKQWYIKLGFDELETLVYHSGNIPSKKRIAPEVGSLILYRKGLHTSTINNPSFSPYAVTVADTLQKMIFELLTAAKASGRIN